MPLAKQNPLPFLLPSLLVIALIFGYPLVQLFLLSVQSTGQTPHFIGIRNYESLLRDPTFLNAIRHNAFLLLGVPMTVVLALILAILLYERIPGWKVYRFALFMPFALAVPVVGIAFSIILQFNGPLNTALRAAGLTRIALDWLGSASLALPSLLGVIVWRNMAFGVVLFLARLMTIEEQLIDAAKIDGASWSQLVRSVLIPQVGTVTIFFSIVMVTNMLSWVFNFVYVMTSGGPGNSTTVTEYYIYRTLFQYQLPNLASAAGCLIFAILGVGIAVWFFRYSDFLDVGID